jgi:hypothetical protein
MVHSAWGTAHPSLLEPRGLNGVGSRTLAWHNNRQALILLRCQVVLTETQ